MKAWCLVCEREHLWSPLRSRSCTSYVRHIGSSRFEDTIIPIITAAKVVFESYWLLTVTEASGVSGCKLTECIPITTFMKLAIPSRTVSKSI